MTKKRRNAIRNALASTRMEGLPVSERTEQECIRFLEGNQDVISFVHEILKSQTRVTT